MEYKIKLKRGFQRKLIEKTKQIKNLNWNKFGDLLGISSNYLKSDLRYEKVLLSEALYKKLCGLSRLDYNHYIIKKLDKNWGRSKGGKISKPQEKKVKILSKKYSVELAELIGIILGDGNISEKKGFYYIRICGDSEKDKAYLLDYVKPLIKKLFGLDMGTYQHKKNKELYLTIGSKDLLFTLKNYGLKSGNKIKNKACIPLWVFKSKNHLKACIRGLIDTDGSVIPITGRNYPYIWFTCGSPTLRKDFKKAMSILGYKTSKWNFNGTPETYIGSKKLIQKFYKEIGFSNPKHINRFCSGGVVRSN